LEPPRQPIPNFHTKPDKSARRKRRHARGASFCSLVNPLHPSALTWTLRNRMSALSHLYWPGVAPPRTCSRWGDRGAVQPSPTLLVPSTCPRRRPPLSHSSPVGGARVPRPCFPRLRLRALVGPGRRHPPLGRFRRRCCQLQPPPAGERSRPRPCMSGQSPPSAIQGTRRPSYPVPAGQNGSGPASPVTPSSRGC